MIVAADTGGTFTDLAAYDRDSGRLVYTKSLTTYDDLVDGVMDCVRKAGIDLGRADVTKFGTTLVINTFVERNGARAALVTTEGHRDILELRRGNRPIVYDLRYERDPVLIERDMRFELAERIAGDGTILTPLDETALDEVARNLAMLGVEAVAVSFLNAYANPVHEDRAAAHLRAALPGVYVTAGTELSREWHEYERTATAAANAYVGPRLKDYVNRLDARLRDNGFARTFYLMASNGGVFSVARAEEQPVMLVESGPVGGCIGTGIYANDLGIAKAIAFDMGGTTAKCAVVENGAFEVKSPYYVGGHDFGFPIRGAVLDIVEVGAGGGSIAWLDAQSRLAVGPKSAGSDPGPVAYGRGGTEPTITDANLVLGRLSAASFLGGEMRLDEAAARVAILDRVAAPLGYLGPDGLDRAADGIVNLGAATMIGAIQQITIERGLDPREFALFAFGGGGPMHAAALARELSLPEVVIPPEPGIFSALGMLMADARVDEVRTFLRPLAPETIDEMLEAFAQMDASLRESLARELGPADIMIEPRAMLRFHGQRHALQISVPMSGGVDAVRTDFETAYRRRYGFVEAGAPAEFVSLAITATARIDRPLPSQLHDAPEATESVRKHTRPVYFAAAGGRVETPVYARASLPSGFTEPGPAIIEEYGATTVVEPDDWFEIGRLGEIRIRFDRESSAS